MDSPIAEKKEQSVDVILDILSHSLTVINCDKNPTESVRQLMSSFKIAYNEHALPRMTVNSSSSLIAEYEKLMSDLSDVITRIKDLGSSVSKNVLNYSIGYDEDKFVRLILTEGVDLNDPSMDE